MVIIKKIFAWLLLVLGVLIILWGVWNSYQIFNAQKPVPEIFKLPEIKETSLMEEKSGTDPQEKMGQEIQQTLKEQFEKIMPPKFVEKLFNLFSWSIFMFILIYAGGKLSFLGIKLL